MLNNCRRCPAYTEFLSKKGDKFSYCIAMYFLIRKWNLQLQSKSWCYPSRGTTIGQIDLAMDFALPHLLQDLKRILLSFGLKTILCVCHIQSRAEWSPMECSTCSPFFWLEIKGFSVSLGWRLAEDHDTEWFDSGNIPDLPRCSWSWYLLHKRGSLYLLLSLCSCKPQLMLFNRAVGAYYILLLFSSCTGQQFSVLQ